MNLLCLECKNTVDLSVYPDLAVGTIVECQMCGMTMAITAVNGTEAEAEIVDEGK